MEQHNQTASNIALLAPVPLEHLIDGCRIAETEGKVAFGSRAWEVFRQLDQERHGMPVDVFIYASHSTDARAIATWHARYIGQIESIAGAHPAGMQFRPPSTAKYPNDNRGHWAIFWEVEHLRQLAEHERLSLTSFTGYGKNKRYGRDFVPEGPLLVEHP